MFNPLTIQNLGKYFQIQFESQQKITKKYLTGNIFSHISSSKR